MSDEPRKPIRHWTFVSPPEHWQFHEEWTYAVGANVYIDDNDNIVVYTNSMWYSYDPETKCYKNHRDEWVPCPPYEPRKNRYSDDDNE